MPTPPADRTFSRTTLDQPDELARILNRFMGQTAEALNARLLRDGAQAQLHTFDREVPVSDKRVYVRAKQAAAQSLANATNLTLTGWTEDADGDPNGVFNATTGEFTAPRAGLYDVSGSIVTVQAAGYVALKVFVGATERSISDIGGTVSGICGSTVSVPLRLAAGDVVTLRAYQNSGGAVSSEVSNYNTAIAIIEAESAEYPIAASCWPYDFVGILPRPPSVVLLGNLKELGADRSCSPGALHWSWLSKGDGQGYIRIRNVPFLEGGRIYRVSVLALWE